jgi:hypothetical protein
MTTSGMFVLVTPSKQTWLGGVEQTVVMRWVHSTTVNKVKNSGLDYKHITIINDDPGVVSK